MQATRLGIALGAGAALFAALYLIPFQAAARTAPRSVVTLAMLASAAALTSAMAVVRCRRGLRLNRTALRTGVVLAGLTVAANLALAEALAHTGAAIASAALQTQILFVAAVSWMALGEPVSRRFVVGAALALLGVAVIQQAWAGFAHERAAGVAWALLTSFCFALMLVVNRRVAPAVDPVAVNWLRLCLAVAALALVPGHAAAIVQLDSATWALAVAAAAAGPVAGQLFLMYAVRFLSASHVRLITLASPVLALALGFLAFGDLPDLRELVGGAILVAGIALPLLELVHHEPV
jgi:drug/metabolite transporter (DMT)-like permease